MPQKRGKPHRKSDQAGEPSPAANSSRSRDSFPAPESSSAAEPSQPGQPSDRFLTVPQIAERLGFTDQAIRKWGREKKLPLRKLFGSMGPLGMAESQLMAIITGQGPGAEHGQSTA